MTDKDLNNMGSNDKWLTLVRQMTRV